MIRRTRYVIAVHDLERSARYYRDVLGFSVKDIGDPGWRLFVRDQCLIMAGECSDALPPQELGDHSYFAYLEVDDIDRYYETVIAGGASMIKELRDEPWGMREFGLRTVDGHRIMFGAQVESSGNPMPILLDRTTGERSQRIQER
jgi:predicted enzyme related to lactoylglutathione lyase